jgi:tetratricopeptide (TPR) repeat protein
MAFGFGFNKQKVLSAAEKYVQQGKLQNAIAEYEKIVKADPRDLTVLNTIGDLYARLGQGDHATECFKNVGDAYATQGFTVKAIAMYKKITKLKPTLESVLKLAELYTQQGLFNDARAQYLQVAEEFLRAGELEQAVRIFQKTLEMDPENVAMKVRLAEVYVRLKKKTEAWRIFSEAADLLRERGSLDAAEDILQRMLTLDPGNSYALLLRGKNALEAGDTAGAIPHFEKVADLDSHPDGLRALMKAYLQAGRLAEAGGLASKLLTVHNDLQAISGYADSLIQAGAHEEALRVYHMNAERLLSADPAKTLEHLHTIIGHVRENTQALETLLELLQKAGDTTHISEVSELLAHACVQAGDLERARDLYLQLATVEPQNQMHTRNYQQVVAKLSGASQERPITLEEGASLVDELEATAPVIDQHYPDKVAIAVRAALTDAELFVSYNMPGKALGPLMAALPLAPRDVRLNQRLASLHTRAERFAEAAVCCRTLEGVYSAAGHSEEADRYAELAGKYEGRSNTSVAPAVAVMPSSPWPVLGKSESTGLMESEPVEAPSFKLEPAGEIDLSEEWEGALGGDEAVAPATAAASSEAIAETIEEVQFYLKHSMGEQARAAMVRLEAMTQDDAQLAAVRAELEAADPASATAPPKPLAEVESAEVPEEAPEVAEVTQDTAHEPSLGEFVADLEAELPEDFMAPAEPPAAGAAPFPAPPPEPALRSVAASAAAFAPAAVSPVREKPAPAPVPAFAAAASSAPPPAFSASAAQAPADAGAALCDIFDELKSDLEEGAAPAEEDPENHYNLGVAFREMGLIDEAIGELQKVCQAVDRGVPFSQTMQAYTWLASCFLDKGVPEAALRWFERALKLPSIDEEARVALHYELASAYEQAQNKKAALAHFLEVYGANIDYRDVAERIRVLKS